jgi:histidinol-phosphatase (PHP family)
MVYKTDYHVHTTYSDGKLPPEEYLEAAIGAGLSEIGFSDHLNLVIEGQEWCMDVSKTPQYLTHIRKVAALSDRVAVRTGFEVDYFPGKEDLIHSFLSPLSLDYVIGSVHYMGDTTVDSSPEFFEGKKCDEVFRDYFELLFQAVESGLFDILGHPDLVRIFGHKPSFSLEPFYEKLASKLSRHDLAFEVNTNGRNRKLGEFYPDYRYLHLFRKHNVPVCVNSDAHMPERVGQHFDEAYSLLKSAGYTEMCVFSKRERYMIPARF